ncbi:MAG: M23 family metallopeptidase, partial [Hyphomicrobium sp.]
RDDAVVAGQPLGLAGARMGGSDNGTKPHLHFEIRVRTFVLPASSIGGELNLESSSWDIVLPCYSSLIAAKMRALGLTPNLVGDELRPDSRFEVTEDQFLKGDYAQKPSPPAEDQVVTAPPDGKRYDSYWTIERPGATDALLGSVRGANDAVELYLLTPRETMFERRARSRSRPGDELVFKGQIVRDLARPPARAGLAPDTRAGDAGPARLVGKLTWLDPNENTASRCPSKIVDASGPILEKPVMRYDLTARTPIYDASCRETGEQAEVYSILYYGASPPGGGQASDAPVVAEKDRKSIVEVTRNWGAITLSTSSRPAWLIHAVRPKYPNDPSRINIPRDDYRWVYVGAWPGLRPDGERTDQFGGTVPAFSSDEAGVALWWFWTKVRKASRFKASGNPTFREIARIYGGDNASDATIQNYLTAYVSLGRHYFRNGVPDPDQPILLADPEQRFALAWTMFHHEAGRTPLIDRATFDRGVRMGVDLIQGRYVRYCDYLSHGCGGAAAPPSIPAQPEPGVPVAPPPVAEATPIHPLPTPPVPQPDQPELTALRRENSVLKNRLEQANTRIDTLERKLAASVSASPRPPSGAPTPPATNIKWRHNCRSGSHWLFCTSR